MRKQRPPGAEPGNTAFPTGDFRAIVESSPIGYLITRAGRIVYANPQFRKGAGIGEGPIEGEDALALFPTPELRERAGRRIAAAEAGERQPPLLYQMRAAPEPRWVEVQTLPLRLSTGEATALTVVRDVTAEVLGDEKRLAAEARYHALVDSSPNGIVITKDGLVDFCNGTFARMLGRSAAEEVQGRAFADLCAPESRAAAIETLRGAAAGARSAWVEVDFTRADGSRLDVEAQSEPFAAESASAVLTRVRDIAQRKSAERRRRESEERYRILLENTPDGIMVHRDLVVLFANASLRRMVQLPASFDVAGLPLSDFLLPTEIDNARARARSVTEGGSVAVREYRVKRRDGTEFLAEVSSQRLVFDGEPAVQTVVRDISARKKAERSQTAVYRIAEAASRAESLDGLLRAVHAIVGEEMDARNFFVALADPSGETVTFPYGVDESAPLPPSAPARGTLTGHVLATGAPLLIGPEDDARLAAAGVGVVGPPAFSWLGVPLRSRVSTFGVLAVQSYDRDVRFTEENRDLLTYVSGHVAEAIERQRQEDRIEHLAYHDALTGLPNRLLFEDRLRNAMTLAGRRAAPLAVLFLDIDRFKVINDSLGHTMGDEILKIVASRLAASLREGDTLARRGGDEFLVLLPETPAAGAARVAAKIIETMKAEARVGGHDLSVSVSCGIAVFPENGEDVDALLKSADIAMYRAKESGRDAYRLFNSEMNEEARRRLTLETGLRRALAESRLESHFQPIVDTSSGRVVAAEALLRWRLNAEQTVPPRDFIGVAEQSGLIVAIGAFALREALRRARDWPLSNGLPIALAINLAARQIEDAACVDMILDTLRGENFPPRRLQVEVTESAAITENAAAVDRLRRLRDAGIGVAIDDFGVGYSSLSRLRRLPFDTLKIDSSFIRHVTTDPDDGSVATAVIYLARNLGLSVIAEGVENDEQRRYLESRGCTIMQGYHFAVPQPPALFASWLEHRAGATRGVGAA